MSSAKRAQAGAQKAEQEPRNTATVPPCPVESGLGPMCCAAPRQKQVGGSFAQKLEEAEDTQRQGFVPSFANAHRVGPRGRGPWVAQPGLHSPKSEVGGSLAQTTEQKKQALEKQNALIDALAEISPDDRRVIALEMVRTLTK